MVEKIRGLIIQYQDMILYVFFGALATLVNTVSYYLCYNVFGVSNVPSVIIAWLLAVVFAFFTNKLWVFKSKSFAPEVLKHEIPTFFGARLLRALALAFFPVAPRRFGEAGARRPVDAPPPLRDACGEFSCMIHRPPNQPIHRLAYIYTLFYHFSGGIWLQDC